jgi:hypothetical protein
MAEGDRMSIYDEIKEERIRQDEKYGKDRNKPPSYWLRFTMLELLEAQDAHVIGTEPPHDYRTEMKQVAALAVAAIESYDRQQEKQWDENSR